MQRDEGLRGEIRRGWDENIQMCDVCRVWHGLNPDGIAVVCCTVARLMRGLALRGAARGRRLKTTMMNYILPRTEDRVSWDITVTLPNVL